MAAGMLPVLALVLVAAVEPSQRVAAQGPSKSDKVVKVTVKADPDKPGADGQQVVTVTMVVDKGWHIYANPVGQKDLESAATVVKVGAKIPPVLKVEYPKGKTVKDKVLGDYNVYEDKVAIKATVKRAEGDKGPLEVGVTFQACNDKSCLLPATVKLTLP
jgi:DsbC/DsbD-like thiol-disulfide interchange protein